MKKLKKLLSVISAVTMAISMFASVSAEQTTNWYDYDTTRTINGIVYPIKVKDSISYSGLVVTMFDETVPTAETLGIELEYTEIPGIDPSIDRFTNVSIEEYNPWNYGALEILMNSDSWCYEETIAPTENSYLVRVKNMSEEEAEEFTKELMLSGKVKSAEVLYARVRQVWYIESTDENDDGIKEHPIYIRYNDGFDTSDFSFEKYPEIAENFDKENLSYTCTDTGVTVLINDPTSLYNNEGEMELYNIVNELNETLSEKYEEFESFSLRYGTKYDNDESYAVAKIDIPWGDATGDEIIDLYDAIEVSKHLMGTSTMNDSAVILADINRDGKTDLYDVIDISKSMLLNYVSMNGDIDNSQQVLADFNNDGIINVADILAVNTEHLADVMGN